MNVKRTPSKSPTAKTPNKFSYQSPPPTHSTKGHHGKRPYKHKSKTSPSLASPGRPPRHPHYYSLPKHPQPMSGCWSSSSTERSSRANTTTMKAKKNTMMMTTTTIKTTTPPPLPHFENISWNSPMMTSSPSSSPSYMACTPAAASFGFLSNDPLSQLSTTHVPPPPGFPALPSSYHQGGFPMVFTPPFAPMPPPPPPPRQGTTTGRSKRAAPSVPDQRRLRPRHEPQTSSSSYIPNNVFPSEESFIWSYLPPSLDQQDNAVDLWQQPPSQRVTHRKKDPPPRW